MIISILTVFFCVLYAMFLLWCNFHWNKLNGNGEISGRSVPVTVIIPVRNEEENVKELLDSLHKQTYRDFEVILVNDHSEDNTVAVAEEWIAGHHGAAVKCISSIGNSKKEAIAGAIDTTYSELIITTDADCRMNEEWISVIVSHYMRTKHYLISAPVRMNSDDTDLGKIQSAEYAGLTAMGAAAFGAGIPMFCSGANLAFTRSSFMAVGGYGGSRSSSGDDTQLMRKIASRWPHKISYLKHSRAVVTTLSSKGHLHLFEQRRRWASKIPFTLSPFTVSIAVLAWIVHLLLLIGLFRVISGADILPWAISLLIKVSAEILLLSSAMNFMKQKLPFGLIIAVQPFYALYIVLIGVIAPFTKFNWKGRVVK